jgi:hypothetical protein
MAGLKEGIIVHQPAWKIPVISKKKLLKQPEISVDIKFDTSDVKEMPDKQFKAFEQAFDKRFAPEFKKVSESWFGEMQKTMDMAEDALEKLSQMKAGAVDPKKLAEDIVTKANAALNARCKAWVEMASKLGQRVYDDAYEDSIKAMKLKITKAKAKVGAKIVLIVLLTLTAAALTIAVSVATAGVGAAIAPVVIAGISTAGKALFSSFSEFKSSHNVLANTIAAVETDTKNIITANTAYLASMQKTAGTFDKIKAFTTFMSADVEALNKHVGQLDKLVAVTRDQCLKQIKALHGMADQLAKVKSGSPEAAKLDTRVLSTQRSIDGALKSLGEIAELRTAADGAREGAKRFSREDVIAAMPKLVQPLAKIKAAIELVQQISEPVQTIVEGIQQLAGSGH